MENYDELVRGTLESDNIEQIIDLYYTAASKVVHDRIEAALALRRRGSIEAKRCLNWLLDSALSTGEVCPSET